MPGDKNRWHIPGDKNGWQIPGDKKSFKVEFHFQPYFLPQKLKWKNHDKNSHKQILFSSLDLVKVRLIVSFFILCKRPHG